MGLGPRSLVSHNPTLPGWLLLSCTPQEDCNSYPFPWSAWQPRGSGLQGQFPSSWMLTAHDRHQARPACSGHSGTGVQICFSEHDQLFIRKGSFLRHPPPSFPCGNPFVNPGWGVINYRGRSGPGNHIPLPGGHTVLS